MAVYLGLYSSALGWTYLAFMLLLGLCLPLLATGLSRRLGAQLIAAAPACRRASWMVCAAWPICSSLGAHPITRSIFSRMEKPAAIHSAAWQV